MLSVIRKHSSKQTLSAIFYDQKRNRKGEMVPRAFPTIRLFFQRSILFQGRMLHSEKLYPNLSKIGIPIGGIAGLFGSMLGVGGGVIMVHL
jgi:hypothetical protein